MATLSDFLWTPNVNGLLIPMINVYVELVNNRTGTGYVTAAPTDVNGKFTFGTSPPGGNYSIFTSSTLLAPLAGGWIAFGDSAYHVAYLEGDDAVLNSLAVDPALVAVIPTGTIAAKLQLYPGAEAGAIQTASGILHATGVPSNANGNNTDWCISDNGNLYKKAAGVWAAVQPGNPMTTLDDVIIGGASGVQTRLAKGANGTVLNIDQSTGHVVYASAISPPGAIFPGDQAGALQTSSGVIHATGVPSNANGSNNWWCISDNGNLYQKVAGVWNVVQPGNPMTTLDDVIVAAASGVQARLAKGASGSVLTVDATSGHVAWDLPYSVTRFAETSTVLPAIVNSASGTTSNGSTAVTSVSTVTSPGDVGKYITGPGILPYTFIVSCVTNTSIVLSQPAGVGFGAGALAYYGTIAGTTHDSGSSLSPYTRFRAFGAADVASLAGGLCVQQSDDGTLWFITANVGVLAGFATGAVLESLISKRYQRALYINGPTVQASFNFSSAWVS